MNTLKLARMAQGTARGLYTGDEVVRLFSDEDFEGDDYDDGLDGVLSRQ